jgi:diacylglycerol kinase (ATP)
VSESHFFRALRASLDGLAAAWRSERSFRQEVALLAAALPASFLLTPEIFRRAELIACLLAVLAVELLNTSIEKLCDRTTPFPDPAIKIVKDMGSAAVFCALCLAGLVWGATALERLF